MAPRGRHVGIAQHPRDLLYPPLTLHNLHVTRRQAALLSLCNHQMLVGVHGNLGQVRDDERLTAFTRHIHQRLADAAAHLTADTLIDFVEHQGWDDVVRCQHHLQRQHEPRELAT